jgi:predicted DNA-binding protein (MmcQ/YjbR family)
MSRAKNARNPVTDALRSHALSFPGATEEFPWGHSAFKVKGKAFVFMGDDDAGVSFSVKLPASGKAALMFPFTEPTGYGLGKSGWVSVKVDYGAPPSTDMLRAWIDESYRAVAPKKLVAALEGAAPPGKTKTTTKTKATTKARTSKAPRKK